MRPPPGGLVARASLRAALRQAAGGWRPAPLYSSPKGRPPFRESPRRHPDRWWPLQTSRRLPLAPLDISYPAQSGSPLLPATDSRSKRLRTAAKSVPREKYKSEHGWGAIGLRRPRGIQRVLPAGDGDTRADGSEDLGTSALGTNVPAASRAATPSYPAPKLARSQAAPAKRRQAGAVFRWRSQRRQSK
jgi:hypothetical protein